MVRRIMAIVLIAFVLLATPARAAATFTDVANQLVCQCGCTQTLSTCSEPVCTVREEMKASLRQQLDEGKTEAQILQAFVTRYGEQVLVIPPKKGFNLVAWLLPFIVILAGALIIFAALRRWVWQGNTSEVESSSVTDSSDDKYSKQLEKDLKNFNERGYR